MNTRITQDQHGYVVVTRDTQIWPTIYYSNGKHVFASCGVGGLEYQVCEKLCRLGSTLIASKTELLTVIRRENRKLAAVNRRIAALQS